MGLLRRRDPQDAEEADGPPRHGVYRVEVDGERHRFHGDVPYSFWSSAKVILLLSVLLWWLPQSMGYMVAGYVGGRRSGSPWKAVFAALIPVAIIWGVAAGYDAGYARPQIDFLAGLPASIAAGVGSAIPFLQPYTQFAVEYLATFVRALQSLFGMGTNGYLVTVAFAYIGGIVADQTRREIQARDGSSSTSVSIVQPILDRLHWERPHEAEPVAHAGHAHRGHGHPGTFADFRKIPAAADARAPALAPRRRPPEEDDEEEPARAVPAEQEPPIPVHRARDHAAETQRFVERALRQYEHRAPARHHRD